MLVKPKSKSGVLWDKLLFARSFEIALDETPQDCIARLMSLTKPREGFFNPSSREVWTQKTSDETYDFEIDIGRYGRGMSWTSTKCVGVVFRDSWSEKTVVRGRFTVGVYMLLIWGFFVIMFFVSLDHFLLGYTVFLIVIALLYGIQVWVDYRKLQSLVFDALQKS